MKQTYNELYIYLNSEDINYSNFIDFIFALGFEAIEEQKSAIIIRSEDDMEILLFALNEFAKKLSIKTNKEILLKTDLKVKKSEDWIKKYQESVKPINIGNFRIRPDWERREEGKIDVIVNPALSFGSGHHESTYGAILKLQQYLKKDDTLLDVGCGSGILGIVAAKLGAVVDICDTDEVALSSSQKNFKLNEVSYQNSWIGSAKESKILYNVVIANIIAEVLIILSQDLMKRVEVGGVLILSGILDRYLDEVLAEFAQMDLIEKYKNNEWYTIVLKRL